MGSWWIPQKGKHMARTFRMWVELHPPNDQREHYCLESFEQVRTASPNRILHFSLGESPEFEDVEWAKDVVGAQLESLIYRTTGMAQKLQF